jgi:magnesium chelatase subunit H
MPKRISDADMGSRATLETRTTPGIRAGLGGASAPVRVVVVTMDSHLAGAATRAEAMLRSELPGLKLVVHAADEWGVDPAALEECRADIARGDIVVASMLFLDDHIRAVLPALQARRESCDAMVACLSAPEVVKLTRWASCPWRARRRARWPG